MKSLRIVLVSLLSLVFSNLYASQILGGNITWQCLGGDQYLITYTQYKDCFGSTAALPTENVFLIPQGTCPGAFPISINLDFVSEIEISNLCASELVNSTCQSYFAQSPVGGLIPGVVKCVYQNTVTLTPGCTWKIVWNENNWYYAENFDTSATPDAYIYSIIDTNSCADAVSIDQSLAIYECQNNGIANNQLDISNPNGYTLTYSLITPQTTGASLLDNVDVSGYVPLNGISVSPAGLLSFDTASPTLGFYIVTVAIEIDNAGTYVGTVNYSFPVLFRSCIPTVTSFSMPEIQTLDFGIPVNNNTIGVCAGDSLAFSVEAVNTDPSKGITLSANIPAALNPGNPVFNAVDFNPIIGQVSMLTDESMIGTHVISFLAEEQTCVLPSSATLSITVEIYPSITLNTVDTLICNGETLNLTASGGSSYSWSVISGDQTPGFDGNIGNQQLESISTDTQIEVTLAGVPAACHATETIDIAVSLQSVNLAVTDESCLQNDGAIDVTVVGGIGPFDFAWGNSAVTEDLTNIAGGNYCVTVTDPSLTNCNTTVCATVNSTPQPGGTMDIAGSNALTICAGDQATIDFNLTGTGPWVVNGTGAGIAWPLTINASPFSVNVSPATTTTYTMTSVSYQAFPACVTNVNIPVTVTVRPLVTATFTQPTAICAGQSASLTINISQPGNFNVTWSANPVDPASAPNLPAGPWTDGQVLNGVNPVATTVYTITDVQYATGPTCSNPQNNQVTLTVNPLPTADITGGNTICTGDNINLQVDLTGAANWSINGTGAGVTWPINGINTPTYQLNISPAATGNYCITSVTDGNGCTSSGLNDCETVTVVSNQTPSLTIAASTTTTICAGTSVTFTATPTSGGATPSYQWYINPGAIAVGTNSDTYTTTTLTNGQTVYCVMTTSLSCTTAPTATSNSLIFTVNPVVVPSVTINALPVGAICDGTNVTFTASPSNGGLTPTFQWYINNVAQAGQTSNTFSSSSLVNGDAVTVEMTSSAACPSAATVTSNAINMTVTPTPVPSVTISTNPNGAICQGANMTFTATPVNGGGNPQYEWYVNNIAQGVNSATFSTTGLNNNDNVYVELTSDAVCANPSVVQSAVSTVTVNPLLTPSVTIAAVPAGALCAGDNVTFTATPTNGGTTPTYAWYVNNVLNAQTSATLTLTNPANATDVYVVMTSSEQCVTAATGTSATTTLAVNALPTATFASGGAICAGQNFAATINVTGTGPFSNIEVWQVGGAAPVAVLSGAGPTINFSTSTAGDYYISTLDDANCTQSTDSPSVTVVVNPLPTASLSGDAAICAGDNHTFDITFTGSAPFTYSLNTPAGAQAGLISNTTSATYNASSNDPGNYQITTVTDNNGCVSSASSNTSVLTVNPLPTANFDASATICAGETHDFTITFTGTAPFTYDLALPSGPSAGETFAGPGTTLTYTTGDAGNYNVTYVEDANGCVTNTAPAAVSLTVNALPSATMSAAASVCDGTCYDFTVSLTGTGPWDFDVETPIGPSINNTINSGTNSYLFQACDDGDYYVSSITDATGCSNTTQSNITTLTLIPLPTASWVTGDTSYCENSFVTTEISLVGTPPFNVAVNTINAIENTNTLFLDLSAADLYCINTVTDDTGCSSAPIDCIDVVEISTPIVDAGADLDVCVNADIIIGTPAIAGQDYEWDDANGLLNDITLAEPTANTNVPGVYILTLTAYNQQCPATDDMQLTVNDLPTISIVADDDIICYNTTAELTASGADTYDWTASPSLQNGVTSNPMIVLPLVDETFTVTGTDLNGCQNTQTIAIAVGTELIVQETFPQDICFGACDGSILIEPSGSYGNYVINWAAPLPDLDSFDEQDLCAGTYDYTITDAENCVYNGSVTMNPLPQNFIEDVVILPPACYGESTGSIQVIDNLAVEYNITGPVIETNNTGSFGNIPVGGFNILVADALGCLADTSVVINSINPQILVTPTTFPTPFCYEDIVPFEVNVQGGSGNFTVNWHSCESADATCFEGQNSPFFFSLTQDTTLYVYAEDLGAPGCFSDTVSVFAFLNPPIQMEVQGGISLEELCEGQCLDMNAVVAGGNGNVILEWFEVPNTVNDVPYATGTSANVCPEVTTSYYAYAYDGCNPPAYDTLNITVFPVPEVIFTVDNLEGCYPVEVNFENLTDPTLIESCQWNFGNGVVQPICGNITYSYNTLGSFTPSLLLNTVDGCVVGDTLDFPISVYGYPEIDFTWTPADVNVLQNEVQFENLTEGGDSYFWRFSTFGTSNVENPIYTFPDVDLAEYDVCLISETEFGCKDTLCRTIVIGSELQVWVPNAFTPDGDDRNEVFLPIVKGIEPESYKFYVYDRWGTVVFYTEDSSQAWTGNVYNGSYYAQTDMYTWRIEVKRLSDSKYEVFEGYVFLLK